MQHIQSNQSDFNFLLANAQAGKTLGLSHFAHLDQPIGILNYIQIADDIAQQLVHGSLLDWGCGYGQMTYLLRRRGFQVTAFDVDKTDSLTYPDIPLCSELNAIHTPHPTDLPFLDQSFDSVLSCGVLEHVDEFSQPGNELKSLREIERVLRPGGLLFVYQLPQQYGWQETLVRKLRLGYTHPRRYSRTEITTMLEQTGFSIQSIRRVNFIPKNLTSMPNRLRAIYSRFSNVLIGLDKLLCKIPGLNHFAGALEITAKREIR